MPSASLVSLEFEQVKDLRLAPWPSHVFGSQIIEGKRSKVEEPESPRIKEAVRGCLGGVCCQLKAPVQVAGEREGRGGGGEYSWGFTAGATAHIEPESLGELTQYSQYPIRSSKESSKARGQRKFAAVKH